MGSIQHFIQAVNSGAYSVSDYLKESEMLDEKAPEIPTYSVETTSRVERIAVEIILGILSALFLPLGIYRLVHLFGSHAVIRAQWQSHCREPRDTFIKKLQETGITSESSPHVLKRISIAVDGKLIDAMIFGKPENLANKKWTLISNGRSDCYEKLLKNGYKALEADVDALGTNILLYNYQGVGASEGWSTREGIINAHKACLQFLEDEKSGIGAKEILQWGISIGGGVQGCAMESHPLKEGIKYTALKYQTFSDMSKVPNPLLGLIIKIFGWELSSISSASKMESEEVPEIILQTSKKFNHVTAEDILDDGVISATSSYARKILEIKKKWVHKKVIGLTGMHCKDFLSDERKKVHACIQKAFSDDYKGFHKLAAV